MPQIKQQVTQAVEVAQKSMEQVDMRSVSNKVQKSIQLIKNKMENLKKSNKNNEIAITINNKEAEKQITQLEKEIDSLQKKINARQIQLDITNSSLDKMHNEGLWDIRKANSGMSNKDLINTTENKLSNDANYSSLIKESDKLNNEIMKYNSLLESAKEKLSQLKQETNQTSTSQNKLTSFFNAFKGKIEQAKDSVKGIKNNFNQMPKITQKITNNIKNMGTGVKNGLKNVLKYAAALFSLRTIYSALSSSANSWLSSQNAQAQQLSANIEYMKYAMGSVFAPVIEYVMNLVYQLMKAIQSLVYAFSGINIFAKATASSMNKTASSASKASKSLAGVHSEISNVSENDGSSGSGTKNPSMDLSQMDNTPNSIIDSIKNGDWYSVGVTIAQKLNDAMNNIPWNKIQNGARNIARGMANFLNGFIGTTDWEKVGNTFAQGINTIIYTGHDFISTFNWSNLGSSIANIINGFFKNTDWSKLAETLSLGVQGVLDLISGFAVEIDLKEVVISIVNFVVNIDWEGMYESFYRTIGSLVGALAKAIVGFLKDTWEKIKEYFKEWITGSEEQGGNIVEGLLKGILNPFAGIKQWIKEHIFQPFINGFKEAFGIHSPSTVMAEMGVYMIDGLKNGLLNIWTKVKAPFEELKTKISNKFTEIKTNISNWSSNTKETIKEWSNSIKNNISTGLDKARTTISTWGDNIKTTFTNLGSKATTWGKDLVDNMASGIKNNISKVTNAVNSVASKIKSLLGFSEPEDGPLSNFHTYMPDMIELMVSGIRSNMSKVTDELEKLTTNMSYTINTPDINPLEAIIPINSNNIKLNGSLSQTLNEALSNHEWNSNSSGQQIQLAVYVGNKKLGDILLDNLRDMKRQTGNNLEALVGG